MVDLSSSASGLETNGFKPAHASNKATINLMIQNEKKEDEASDRSGDPDSLECSSVSADGAFVQQSLTVIDAASLFGSSREVGIRYAGSLYRLKITRHGKLILNK